MKVVILLSYTYVDFGTEPEPLQTPLNNNDNNNSKSEQQLDKSTIAIDRR